MFLSLTLLLAALAAPQTADSGVVDEITVVGSRDDCQIRYADKTMSDAEFNARAQEWKAGRPLRVKLAADADFSCMKQIAFRLMDKGVRRIDYVDPDGHPAAPLQSSLPRPSEADTRAPGVPSTQSGDSNAVIAAREQRFFRKRAAEMIQAGDCAGARKLLLDNADLEGAAQAVTICSVH